MAKIRDQFLQWASREMKDGEGLHGDIWRAAILLLEQGWPDDRVFPLLRQAADRVDDRRVPDREILSAISYAHRRLSGQSQCGSSPRWPEFDASVRAEVVRRAGPSLYSLADAADRLPQDPATYLSQIYAPHELICLGATAYSFQTYNLPAAIQVSSSCPIEYVNPNPMSSVTGRTQDGRESHHCAANTGPKVYQIIEFDTGRMEEHAALLWHLARSMPLFLVVYSGGKSLHGWFDLTGRGSHEVEHFFADAVLLGADRRMWPSCQFARLPGGHNNRTGRHQTVVFFHPPHLLRLNPSKPDSP